MTFVSVAEAAHHLGIDAKTLRRWLADAQLLLQNHPGDGRKKGMSSDHLQILARLHQRSLPSEVPPIHVNSEAPPLPAALLELPEQLSALQTQIALLQQQVADLTRLLQMREPAPATPAAQTLPTKANICPSKPALQVPRSRPAVSPTAKPPRKPVYVIPRVEYSEEGHYVVICPKHGLLPFEPDTEEWFAWVKEQDSFRFVGKIGHFTAHHEWRIPKGAWRAHQSIHNRTVNLRLALTQDLTIAVLEQASEALQAHHT